MQVQSLQSELQFKEAEINEMKTKLHCLDKNKSNSPPSKNRSVIIKPSNKSASKLFHVVVMDPYDYVNLIIIIYNYYYIIYIQCTPAFCICKGPIIVIKTFLFLLSALKLPTCITGAAAAPPLQWEVVLSQRKHLEPNCLLE